jgi:nicotinamidase-related amidase
MVTATPAAARSLLNPNDHLLLLIDYQSQMAFPLRTMDIGQLRSNVAMLGKGASGFEVPTVVTTVAADSFSGPMFPELLEIFANAKVVDRTTMNSWEDPNIIDRVNATGKSRIVMAGLWTSVCIVGPALSAIDQGFTVYVVTDACGDVSDEAHERAVTRMVQAGAIPLTALQYLLELQRDWARASTYGHTTGVARVHAGGYGLGIQYAAHMFGGHEGGGG